MSNFKLWLAPSFRFIVELTTWIWLLLQNWILLPISLAGLGMFNFPGDKRPEGVKSLGFLVPGYVRILVEVGSAGLGVYAAYYLFGSVGLIAQSLVSLVSFGLDFRRWLWMLGFVEVPNYATIVHKKQY